MEMRSRQVPNLQQFAYLIYRRAIGGEARAMKG